MGQVSGQASGQVSDQVQTLINTIRDKVYSISELQKRLDIKSRRYVREEKYVRYQSPDIRRIRQPVRCHPIGTHAHSPRTPPMTPRQAVGHHTVALPAAAADRLSNHAWQIRNP